MVRYLNRALAVADLHQSFYAIHKIKASDINIYKMDVKLRRAKVLAYVGKDVEFSVFNKIPNTTGDFVGMIVLYPWL